ncbi:MAG: hypothetical protein QOD75_3996 [Blastocatellia bacterium]|jgi:hypothetical protein|nr:hypothetical protein [Blastocatellia bacterium]
MKKYLSLVLSVLLLHVFSFAPLAHETPKEKARKDLLVAQVKAGIDSLGTGTAAHVRVVLYDKTKYHGYITEIAEDHFVVADAKTGATAPIAYSEVRGIKGNNLSTGAKIGIGLAIAAAVGIVIAVVAGRDKNSSAPTCTQTAQVGVPCPAGCVCIQ